MLARSGALKNKAEDASLLQSSNAGTEYPHKLKGIETFELSESVPQKLPTRNIIDLPVDVIYMIFKYLDTNEIASCVLPVCKSWYDLGRNPILWKKIRLGCNSLEPPPHGSIALIQRARLLTSLSLNTGCEASSILECVAKSCPLLSSLNLEWCTLNSDGAVKLLVSSCPCLERLRLVDVSGSAVNELAELTTLVELATFELLDMDDFLMRLSINSRQLENVNLKYYDLSNHEHLVPLLTNLKSVIKKLALFISVCSSATFRAVVECANLESIKLFFSPYFFDPDLFAIKKLKKLKRIRIVQFPLEYHHLILSWKSFISNICSDHIEFVCFNECYNVNSTLEEVLSSRDDTILHRAKTVNLCNNDEISDLVVELILKRNPFLESLSLSHNSGFIGLAFNTTDTSIAPALRYLDVGDCEQVLLPYLSKFLENRPSLTIIGPNWEKI